MKKIQFVSPVIINPLSWSLVGVSAKPNSLNPICKYGTGLKYAIAICVRKGWPIKVVTKNNHTLKEYVFSSAKEDFRGNEHDIVTCNGEKLPFTTHYGSHWENWTVIRELYSNAIDEDGYMRISENEDISNGSTLFSIESEELGMIANEIHKYILNEKSHDKIVYENDKIQIPNYKQVLTFDI
jgi:hypothetical protein